MSVSYQERQVIERNRRVYFNSRDGREALADMLENLGLFRTQHEWMAMLEHPAENLRGLTEALLLLSDLGVLIAENFDNLIQKMSELPLPDVKET